MAIAIKPMTRATGSLRTPHLYFKIEREITIRWTSLVPS